MSALLEYIKLLPEAFKNADKVVEGIMNNTKRKFRKLPVDEQEEIIRRRVICEACPFMSYNAKENGTYKGDRKDKFCTACSCAIDYKTASLSSECGLSSYNKRNPDKQLPLKWTAYFKNQPENTEQTNDTETSR